MSANQPTYHRAMSKKELASAYGVSLTCLRKWLKPIQENIGAYVGKTFTPAQIKIIIDHLGDFQED